MKDIHLIITIIPNMYNYIKDWTIPGFGGELRKVEAGAKRYGGTRNGRTPKVYDMDLGAG